MKHIRLLSVLFFISMGVHAQKLYLENGFNAFSKINYNSTENIEFSSQRNFLPSSYLEIGLKYDSAESKSVILMGRYKIVLDKNFKY